MTISIEIGNNYVHIAEGMVKPGRVEIFHHAKRSLDPGVVDGNIKNVPALISALRELMTEIGCTAKKAVITLNTDIFVTKEFEIPFINKNELNLMINNEIRQYINSTKEYVVEYTITEVNPKKNSIVHVHAYAAPKDTVAVCFDILKQLRLKPIAFDCIGNSISKLVNNTNINTRPINDRSILLAQVDINAITCHIFDNGKRVFTKAHTSLGTEFSAAVENGSIADLQDFDFSDFDFKNEELIEKPLLYRGVSQYVEQLAYEFQRLIQFQFARNSSSQIQSIYIYGSMSKTKGLTRLLESILNLNVQKISSLDKLYIANQGNISELLNLSGAMIRLKEK